MTRDCALCGRATDDHDRHVRYRLPEPVLRLPDAERTPGTWASHEDPDEAVMLQVPGLGGFVRCLLPVRLDGGHTVTFGVWAGVHPDDLRRAYDVWLDDAAYPALVVDGRLANDVKPWGMLAAPVTLRVRDPGHTPYVTESTDPLLARVLTVEWPHDEVLAALP